MFIGFDLCLKIMRQDVVVDLTSISKFCPNAVKLPLPYQQLSGLHRSTILGNPFAKQYMIS